MDKRCEKCGGEQDVMWIPEITRKPQKGYALLGCRDCGAVRYDSDLKREFTNGDGDLDDQGR